MNLTTEMRAHINATESRLAGLDPLLDDFCARHGYSFRKLAGVWPRREGYRRDEVDRIFALTLQLSVPEFLERGFFPEMPWALWISAFTHDLPARFLTFPVFRGCPFSSLAHRLPGALEAGWERLNRITLTGLIEHGKEYGKDLPPAP